MSKIFKHKWLVGIAYAIFLIGLLEIASTIILNFFTPDPMVKDENHYVINPYFGFHDLRFEVDSASIQVTKPKGTLRIMSFGASTTAGWPFGPNYSYTSQLEQILRHKYPNQLFEFVNLAVPGFDSREVSSTLQRSMQYEPDIVLVYTSHNIIERYSLQKLRSGFYSRTYSALRNFATAKLFDHYVTNLISTQSESIMPDSTCYTIFDKAFLSAEEKQLVAYNYKDNIEDIISTCADNDVKLVFISPVNDDTYRGPNHSSFTTALSASEKASFHKLLLDGIAALSDSLYDQALATFTNAYQMDSGVAIVNYYMAQAYSGIGKTKVAKKYYDKGKQLDGLWAVCPPELQQHLANAVMSSTWPETYLVNVNLHEYYGTDSLLDPSEMFIDEIHPVPLGHNFMAKEINKLIESKAWLAGPKQNSWPNLNLNHEEILGEDNFRKFSLELGIYQYHISFWTYDAHPILLEASANIALSGSESSRNEDEKFRKWVYEHMVNKKLGRNPDIAGLVKRWNEQGIRDIIYKPSPVSYHFIGLRHDFEEYLESKN